MKKRRSSTDVVAQILQVANGGATRTRIMYGTGLPSRRLRAYVFLLVRNGLLQYEPMEQKYRTAERGFEFLQTYQQMNMLSSVIDVMKQYQF
ncbi:MAG TPA: winged helix-turn-helix domain-containing protein [Nitrososphaera sp.]|nr:winged helix-turn-helix domain-containing protein [Nitrososphaera sp.]